MRKNYVLKKFEIEKHTNSKDYPFAQMKKNQMFKITVKS
jgi:hypothetical protein